MIEHNNNLQRTVGINTLLDKSSGMINMFKIMSLLIVIMMLNACSTIYNNVKEEVKPIMGSS